ncbi:GPR1/FUN34/yaaH family-domain-containing protein [Cryomyces antarcticus]|uniref:GPR1/FUN34/YaaH-class plasma membrane protein n=1 Tax=Cryomyces antarcticus TaxID=329879 RepID=A0ABR0M8Y6_9PEZI|nr:hypothetical protein LTR39_000602 [Cryomyces antarcticus]KAK5020981.1 hypothetical protein LTR60_000164 [Cryomyces antarcticus]KAK5296584.1 hypothetical protein LTR16_000678 [Cryomyces antarcticus]
MSGSSEYDSSADKIQDFQQNGSREDYLRRINTAESVSIPKDVFEKLYLSPEQPAAGDLRKRFGNPTPIALIGFLLAATPNACVLMGWRGAGGGGGAILCPFIFFGGILQFIGGFGEWILGNTFSSSLFFTYGAFWLVQGCTLIPWFGVGANYSPTGNTLEGSATPEFYATFAFYLLFMGVVTFCFMICAIRTNIVLFMVLLILVIAFGCLSGAYWQFAEGNVVEGGKLVVAGGACALAFSMLAWYLLLVQLLEAVDFPFTLPVGDLSTVVPGKSLRTLKKMQSAGQ